jgi:hypothetical protein
LAALMTLSAAPVPTCFLLSPASANGARARLITSRQASFPLADRLRTEGVPIADLYSFVSALYFRGKIAYARRFAATTVDLADAAILIIAPGFGLVPPDWPVTLERLRRMTRVRVDPQYAAYARPLREHAAELTTRLPDGARVVLLGSVASGKYLDLLIPCFGPRLHFPAVFAGLGDMQRGSRMLTAARTGLELAYTPLLGRTGRPAAPSPVLGG